MKALGLLLGLLVPLLLSPGQESVSEPQQALEPEFTERQLRVIQGLSPLPDPPPDPTNRFADDPAAAALGQALFFDVGLSSNGKVSCATCHDPAQGFSDGRHKAQGLGLGTRRSPTIWNVAYGRWFFWDGRADSLWSQAIQPIEHQAELDGDRVALLHHIAGTEALRVRYEALFGELPDPADFPPHARPLPKQPEHPDQRAWSALGEAQQQAATQVLVQSSKALAAYQRLLINRDAPFDRFVEGLKDGDTDKLGALNVSAKRGLSLFIGRGQCRLCHHGPNFTDGEFHNLSLPTEDGGLPRDAGRYQGLRAMQSGPFRADGPYSDDPTGEAAQRTRSVVHSAQVWGEFKTPTLRGLTGRGPFGHAGQFKDLAEVLGFYSTLSGSRTPHQHQESILKPLHLTPRELDDLTAFLGSLEGANLDPSLLRAPAEAPKEAGSGPDPGAPETPAKQSKQD